MIDATYRTLADEAHRGMAGLSMGGMQTRVITMANPDLFSTSASSAAAPRRISPDAPHSRSDASCLFVSFGSR